MSIAPHRHRRRTLLGIAAAGVLTGCGALDNFVGSGEDNTEPPAELVDFEPGFEIKKLWSRKVGAGVAEQYLKLRPALAGTRVFAASRKGDVAAYDADSGERIWETSTGVSVSGGPGVGEGLVMVGTSDGEVLALHLDSGELAWRARVSSEVLAPPAAANGVVVARTVDGKLFGLSVGDGSRLWVYDRSVPVLTLRGTSSPALSQDLVVAGFDSGRLVAVSLENGQTLWEQRVAVPSGRSELERLVDIDADPVVTDDTVYVVTFQGHVAGLDLVSGSILWRREMSSHTGLGIDATNVYVTDDMSHVWALDRFNSASVWRQQKMQGRALTSPASFRGYVVVADFEGYVHWLRREDGQFVARARVDDGVITAPISTDNAVYVFDRGGTLTALAPE